MSESTREIAERLYRELFELEALARGKNLSLDLDALEVRFGRLAEDARQLCERLKPERDSGELNL